MLNQIKGIDGTQIALFPKILNIPKNQVANKVNDQIVKDEEGPGIIGKVCSFGGGIAGALSGALLLGPAISSACTASPLIGGIAGFFSGGIIGGGAAVLPLLAIKNSKISNDIRLLLLYAGIIGGEFAGVILGASGVIPNVIGNVIGGTLGTIGGLFSGALIWTFIESSLNSKNPDA